MLLVDDRVVAELLKDQVNRFCGSLCYWLGFLENSPGAELQLLIAFFLGELIRCWTSAANSLFPWRTHQVLRFKLVLLWLLQNTSGSSYYGVAPWGTHQKFISTCYRCRSLRTTSGGEDNLLLLCFQGNTEINGNNAQRKLLLS